MTLGCAAVDLKKKPKNARGGHGHFWSARGRGRAAGAFSEHRAAPGAAGSRSASGARSEPWPRSRAHDAAARRRRLPVRTHTTPPSARTRCPLAADPGCNLPTQRSSLASRQMVAKPARRRSPRRHQQRRRRRSSSHSASRAVRLPHAAPIGLLHCTSGATMCHLQLNANATCADADRVECTAAGRARLGPSRPDGAARRPQADGSWPMPAVSWPFGLGHSSWRRAELSPPAAGSQRLRQRRLDGASGRARRVRQVRRVRRGWAQNAAAAARAGHAGRAGVCPRPPPS